MATTTGEELMSRLWILGAADPEMEAIERLLTECGEATVYASPDGDRRVRPAEACDPGLTVTPANGLWTGAPDGDPTRTTVYTVECAIPPGMDEARRVVIDHHRPGDPGYGQPPEEFLAAASIGQVIAELARLAALPVGWPIGGGADADMAGVVWIDTAGIARVGESVPSQTPIPDPCRWRIIPTALVSIAAVAEIEHRPGSQGQRLRVTGARIETPDACHTGEHDREGD